MSRMLAVAAMGLALCAAEPLRVVTVHAAGQAGSKTAAASSQVTASNQRPLDRALLDQYCVTCHNERLKTGGLSLDKVDVNDTRGQRRSAREDRPQIANRSDAAAGASAAGRGDGRRVRRLDRDGTRSRGRADAQPGPGRLASAESRRIRQRDPRPAGARRRWRRAAAGRHGGLRLRQQRRRALDHAGLMSRYMSAATKISRLAIGKSGEPADHAGLQARI